MKAWLQQLPFRRRVTLVILMISGIVLLLSATAIAVYEWFDFRSALARDTSVLADIVANNVGAALAFQDEKAAQDVLNALRSEQHIVAAGVYSTSGARFASYVRDDVRPTTSIALRQDGAHYREGRLHVFRPVVVNGKRIGTIYLEADLEAIYSRLRLAGMIALLVLVVATFIALALSSWLQRPISEPILALARAARVVTERKDYSVRAPEAGSGEIRLLTSAFNEMLAGIGEREQALQDANDALRAEIAERRLAEERASAQASRLAQLNQITRAIGERQDVESIYQAVIRSLEEHLPVDLACVCRRDPDDPVLVVSSIGLHGADLPAALGMSKGARIPIDANGLSRCVGGELVYEPDVQQVAMPFPQRLARGGLRALVVAPLAFENQVFGVLVAARRQPESFSSGECEFLRQLSEHVALAAHQADLYNALQGAYDDLRQTQQAAVQQERLRALGQMASGIAHDINNAIAPVSLYIGSLLEKEPNLSERAREWLETIERAVDDVAQTVARMREFYRQREPQVQLTSVDLNRIAEQVISLTRARWWDMPQQRGVVIDVRKDFTPQLPPALGGETEIREALTNLIFNAVDAMPSGGTLTVRTRALPPATDPAGKGSASRVVLEVIDSGVGMDEDTRRRCLEPFFTTKGERGTGLGLAMVYGMVRRTGAELEIDSQPGHGTTMRIVFRESDRPPAWLKSDSPGAPSRRRRLLVVDDDPVLLKSLREILEGDGHMLTTATGGQAGIEAFRAAHASEAPFDAVITDLGMPYVDGRKVLAAVKTASPTTPVILLTGWGQRMKTEGDMPPNVDWVVGKPPKIRELREALEAVVPRGLSDTFG